VPEHRNLIQAIASNRSCLLLELQSHLHHVQSNCRSHHRRWERQANSPNSYSRPSNAVLTASRYRQSPSADISLPAKPYRHWERPRHISPQRPRTQNPAHCRRLSPTPRLHREHLNHRPVRRRQGHRGRRNQPPGPRHRQRRHLSSPDASIRRRPQGRVGCLQHQRRRASRPLPGCQTLAGEVAQLAQVADHLHWGGFHYSTGGSRRPRRAGVCHWEGWDELVHCVGHSPVPIRSADH
jgi:hypothetical protein